MTHRGRLAPYLEKGMAKKPIKGRSMDVDLMEFGVKVDFDTILEEMVSHLSSADIVTFIVKLAEGADDFDITKELYEHFHAEVMRMV